MKNVLLLKAGDAANAIRLTAGDYDRWFIETVGAIGVRFEVVYTHLGQQLPARVKDYDGVMMTGSPLSVTEPAPWMLRAGSYLREAGEQGVPVLGVCFGHQLLAHAFGARVVRNPLGREIGTVEVDLTAEGLNDPLFKGLPPKLTVQTTHEDVVEHAPRQATVLASNPMSALQAFRIGKHLRAVQFHPEASAPAIRAVVEARAAKLDAEGVARGAQPGERVSSLLAGVRASPHGRAILLNFLDGL